MRLSLLVTAAVALSACGSTAPGSPCNTAGFLCFDQVTAMECQLGTWVALPCRGPTGCQRAGNTITCDMSANQEDDACASSAVGSGLCTADMTATLECRNDPMTGKNTLKKTNTCRTCSIQRNMTTMKDEVVCQP